MPGRAKEGWRLDQHEVDCLWMGGNSSGRRKARLSRSLDLQSAKLELEHRPTGARVAGSIPAGNYSRAEMRLLRQKLHDELFRQLEEQVARRLRIRAR